METVYDRTKLLIGKDGIDNLKRKAVIVFGLGGVGGMAVEALVRAGVGNISLVDYDTINITNINRQIIALHSNIGQKKVSEMKKRINDINPDINVKAFDSKLTYDNVKTFALQDYDFIVDAIDDVSAKIVLIKEAYNLKIPIVSSMGAGDKINPEKLSLQKIKNTDTCPLAKSVRGKLRKEGIEDLIVVCSSEKPERMVPRSEQNDTSSISFVPTAAGLLLAKHVIISLLR